ncbi:MAG: glycosyl transferase family 1 [Chloroflexota bacterium]|nr:MAG: glycosyl transferase family 1 [Chloroflexota bacterium]
MRILVVSNAPPRADHNTMGVQQTFHRLRKLAGEHEFTVAFTNPENLPEPQPSSAVPFQLVRLPNPARPRPAAQPRARLKRQFRAWRQALFETKPQIYHEKYNPVLRDALDQVIQSRAPDLVHIIGEPMLMNAPREGRRLLADFPDLFSILFARTERAALRRPTHQWQHAREIQKLKRVERAILATAAAALFVSETDRAAARQIAPTARTFTVPNAVDLDFFQSDNNPILENSILFTGTLSYMPNIQALEFFTREIFPQIQSAAPAVELHIVGYKPAPTILAMQNARIHVHADVADVRPFIERATVCIAPILSGSGTRIKIIEAWAMRKAVVSTSIGAEGLEARDGTHLILADDARNFAAAVIALLDDSARRRAVGEAGYQLAAQKYSMTRAAQTLNQIYQTLGARDAVN